MPPSTSGATCRGVACERSAADLAERLGGRLVGDGATRVSRVDTLEDASRGSVAWITEAQDAARAAKSGACLLIIPDSFPPPPERCSIAVKDPEAALCDLLSLFDALKEDAPEGVHPSAVVDPSASIHGASIGACATIERDAAIGRGTAVHAGAYIGPGVRIGEDCVIWNNVVIRSGTTIGDRVAIHPNTTIGADGFGYIFREGRHVKVPQIGGVLIEDDVEIGASCAVDRAKTGLTRIGAGTKIDNLCQVAHNVRIGKHCVIAGGTMLGGSCVLGDYCAIGGQSAIGDHVTLETGARVAGMSGVSRRVLPGETVRGIPATNNKDYQQMTIASRRLPRTLEAMKSLESRLTAIETELSARTNGQTASDQPPPRM